MSESVPNKEAISKVWDAVKNRNIPMKIMSRTEYEVLDKTSKQADIIYGIPDTGVPAEINYSKEETRIGTWIDGKPLYRVVLTSIKTPGVLEAWTMIAPKIEGATMVRLESYVHLAGIGYESLPLIGGLSGEYYLRAAYTTTVLANSGYGDYSGFLIWTNRTSYLNQPLTIIAEYTKNTD